MAKVKGDEGKHGKRTKFIGTRVDSVERDWIEFLSGELNTTMSDAVRILIRERLEQIIRQNKMKYEDCLKRLEERRAGRIV